MLGLAFWSEPDPASLSDARRRRGEGMDEFPGSAGPMPADADIMPSLTAASGTPAELDPDRDDLAASAARLQADLKLRDALVAEGFASAHYADFADYGHQYIRPLLATGYIFTRCREVGLVLLSLPIPRSEQEDLAQETVAEALRVFKDYGLERGGWRPNGGASLKDYFTGTLLGQFANAWRRWLKAQVVRRGGQVIYRGLPLETLPYEPGSPDPGPAQLCEQRDEIRRGLADIENERTRAALVLSAEGYSQEEIAEILGVTPRAIEAYLRRHRLRVAAGSLHGGRRQ